MRAIHRWAVAIALLLAASGCGSAGAESLTVLVPWSGSELEAFKDVVVKPFKERTGILVEPQQTRALTQELNADIRQDNAPDLAVLPSVGAVNKYASQGEARLDDIVDMDQYGAPWRRLMTADDGHVHALAVKVNFKSLIWYSPGRFPRDRLKELDGLNLEGLTALSQRIKADGVAPWCLGVASSSASGWPGTDWIEDLLLSEAGADAYERWTTGASTWSTGPVAAAWRRWGRIIEGGAAITGGHDAPLFTAVGDAARPMTKASPACYLNHGTFIDQGFGQSLVPDRDYAYFPFPAAASAAKPAHPFEVSADFIGMFHDTTQSRALIQFLADKQTQIQWVRAAGAHAFSANKALTPRDYPGDSVTQGIARMLAPGSGTTLCFDASDAMPPDLSDAFNHAVLQYLHDPGALRSILTGLDRTQAATASPTAPTTSGNVCGTP